MTEPRGTTAGERPDAADAEPPPAAELIAPLEEFENRLRFDDTRIVPSGDGTVGIAGGPKRFLQRTILRTIRPVVRRYDRLLADHAAMSRDAVRSLAATQASLAEVAEHVKTVASELHEVSVVAREHDVRIGRAATELELLADRLTSGPAAAAGSAPTGPAAGAPIATPPRDVLPDAYYWRFETALRGSPESVAQKLEAYRDLAARTREQHGPEALWLDLGCGQGTFMDLLRGWGWRVAGMDRSPHAVESCAARGLDAVQGELPEFLLDGEADPSPAAISLIQVIEHLPTGAWLPTVRYAERRLAPGGVLLIETIDPRNPEALQAFFADVTHTWAAHPRTLEIMAGFAGFEGTEVVDLNPGADGRPQDFALIARKG